MAPTADAVVGMMDAAYFVGRKELLDFLNDALDLKLQKIEQTASGAVACQLFDIMYPNSIAMSKVNWGAKSDYEFVQNYKLLQTGFNKHQVQRYVDVDKLIRAKYQDNLEFMQWFKAFFENGGGPANLSHYRPRDVRLKGKGGDKYDAQFGGGRGGGAAVGAGRSAVGTTARAAAGGAATSTATGASKSRPHVAAPSSPRQHRPLRERLEQPTTITAAPTASGAVNATTKATGSARTASSSAAVVSKDTTAETQQLREENRALQSQNSELEGQVQALQSKVDDLEGAVLDIEKERDFYFEKLRNVEVLLQVHQEKVATAASSDPAVSSAQTAFPPELVDKIFQVLYATPDDEVIVNNDGELIPADQLLSQELSGSVA